VAITAVGSLAKSTGAKTLAVSPTAIGDVLVVPIIILTATPVSGVSGGGVTTWNKGAQADPIAGDAEIWWGVTTTTGSSTITIAGTFTAGNVRVIGCQQFTGGAGVTWSQDGAGAGSSSTTPASSGNYPSVVPSNAGELYVGVADLTGGTPGGSSTGFLYFSGSAGGFESGSQFVYNLSAPNPSSPPWTQASAIWCAVSVLLSTSASSISTQGMLLAI
jgi:hypothetical protein